MEQPFSFGAWLRRRRKALDMTQDELARCAGCALGTIKGIEADDRRPSKQLAARLADCLSLQGDQQAAFVKAARAALSVDQLPSALPPVQPLAPIPGTADAASVPPRPQTGGALPARGHIAAAPALPSGTITFLFTDIEGSTRLWEQHPQTMPSALVRHDTILHKAIDAHRGVIFKTVGDAVCAAFEVVVDALNAALAAQRALHDEDWGEVTSLRVRMALHIGAAEQRDGDYVGLPLNRVARLLAVGHGGQIVISQATALLFADTFLPDTELRDLGQHRLKDLSLPEQIFQVVASELPDDFPPLKTLDAHRTNLPAQPTALLGRLQELARVCALLRRADVRLITLTGPGGTGKTRLAVQAAADQLDVFEDGVWFVDLAPLSDPNTVIATMMHTLGIKAIGTQPLLEQLQGYLREKQLLLLLDNFEQVVEAAPYVAELLAAAPQLKVLVTSRVVLRLRGEQEYAVPPLALPDLKHLPVLDVLSHYAAVELFIQRAQHVKPDFQITNASAPAVAEICARLDGLPLAIELAAARIKLFSPEALLLRLDRRLKFLTGGARDLPARQQTIRNTIDWSYHLLDDHEKTLFARLGVFVGGCTVEAAEWVCNANGDLPFDFIDGIAALADKSLLRQQQGMDGEPRFVMLETVREYALERLETSGEAGTIRRRHADYFLRLADATGSLVNDPERLAWRRPLEIEYDNLRTALAWSHAAPDGAETQQHLVGALSDFWFQNGALNEARDWIEQALTRSHTTTALAQAKLFRTAAGLAFCDADWARGITFQKQALERWRQLGDRLQISEALRAIGTMARNLGDLDQSRIALEEALLLFQEADNPSRIANTLLGQGDIAFDLHDYTQATSLFQEGLALALQHGDSEGAAMALMTLARVARADGDYLQAVSLYEESLAGFSTRDTFSAFILGELGIVLIDVGDYRRAEALFRVLMIDYKDARWTFPAGLEGLAAIAAAHGDGERAAQLWGAAERVREATNVPMDASDIQNYERWISLACKRFEAESFSAAWAEGRAMSLEQTIAYALEPGPDSARSAAAT